MRVEVVKSFGIYSVGAVIPDMYPGQARTLMARGLVKEIAAYETRPARAPQDRMMKPARGRRDMPGAA